MSRPSFAAHAYELACTVAKRSTCRRMSVGCILFDIDRKILATGYNGSPQGFPNCISQACAGADKAANPDACISVHAEINALMQCADVTHAHTAFVTHYPCFRCMKALLNTGVKEIYYTNYTSDQDATQTLLNTTAVTICHYDPENT